MKILQLVQKPQRRGAEVFAFQLSDELRRQGHQVCTTYLYPYQGSKSLLLQCGDQVLNGRENHLLEKMPGVHPVLLQQVCRVIDQFQPDVVQVNGGRAIKYGSFAKKSSRFKTWRLVYRNIDDPKYWVTDPLRRWFYRQLVMPGIDGAVGVSEATLQNVKTMYGLNIPATFIPNGIDTSPLNLTEPQAETRRTLGVPSDCQVVLFMGNLTRQKRPDRFLRVIKAVAERYSHLEAWFLGDGPMRESLVQEVENLGLQKIVRFWGYQTGIAPYIYASDLLLVTSDSDGIPAVILEAGYLGKPTVASNVGGISECVLDGQTGFLADPQDEEALTNAVLTLLTDQNLRAEFGQRAQKWVGQNYTMDHIAERYLNFYQQLLPVSQKNCHGSRN